MKKLAFMSIFVAVAFISGHAQAERKFNFGTYLGFGINSSPMASTNLGLKLKVKYCPLGLEAMFMLPHGFSASLPIYLVNTERFKFHIILPFMGIEVPFMSAPVSVDWLKKGREWNLMIGAGAEVQVDAKKIFGRKTKIRRMGFNLDFRVFVPNPLFVMDTFGDYGVGVFRQAVKEGYIWAGTTFWF